MVIVIRFRANVALSFKVKRFVVGAGGFRFTPDAVVGTDAELLHVALGAVVVRADEVPPRLLVAVRVHVFQFSPPVSEPVADLRDFCDINERV